MTAPIPRELERIVEEARGLIEPGEPNLEYERALVELIIRVGDLSHDADTNTVRDWLELPSLRTCPVCADRYDLDDGIDWEACPAHVDDVDPYSDKNRGAATQETRIDAEQPYVVVDTKVDPGEVCPVVARFATEDEAATFIETLPEYLTGRYGLDGPADD